MGYEISVLISTYNNRELVAKKLAEIQAQTLFARAEFIFIETHSPGRERELLGPFCREHPNCKLITRDERQTLYEAWNLGWDQADSPLICNSNMDDSMHPRLLEEVVKAMGRRSWEVCSVLIAGQQEADPALDDWSPGRLGQLSLGIRPGPFTAWRARIAGTVGKFDGRLIGAGDKDFWSRIQARGVRYGFIWKVLYLYTRGARQLSKAGGSERRTHDKGILSEKGYPMGWPRRYRWRVYCLRGLFAIWPGLFCRPLMSAQSGEGEAGQ